MLQKSPMQVKLPKNNATIPFTTPCMSEYVELMPQGHVSEVKLLLYSQDFKKTIVPINTRKKRGAKW